MEPARQKADERDEDGSLIRWMLSLTPGERLNVLQANVSAILELRERNGWTPELGSADEPRLRRDFGRNLGPG